MKTVHGEHWLKQTMLIATIASSVTRADIHLSFRLNRSSITHVVCKPMVSGNFSICEFFEWAKKIKWTKPKQRINYFGFTQLGFVDSWYFIYEHSHCKWSSAKIHLNWLPPTYDIVSKNQQTTWAFICHKKISFSIFRSFNGFPLISVRFYSIGHPQCNLILFFKRIYCLNYYIATFTTHEIEVTNERWFQQCEHVNTSLRVGMFPGTKSIKWTEKRNGNKKNTNLKFTNARLIEKNNENCVHVQLIDLLRSLPQAIDLGKNLQLNSRLHRCEEENWQRDAF